MRDPFANYDAWLEAPYQAMCAQEDAVERAIVDLGLTDEEAEEYDFDAYFAELDQEQADAMYEDYLEAQEAYEVPEYYDGTGRY